MASGKRHDRAGVTLALAIFAGGALAGQLSVGTPLSLGCFVGTLWFSPDLDCASRPYKRWGLLRFLWWPYQKLISHRSQVSHSPIFGTLGRLLYFTAVSASIYVIGATLGWWAITALLDLALGVESALPVIIAGLLFVVGLEIATLLHLAMDGILLGKSRKRRKRRR